LFYLIIIKLVTIQVFLTIIKIMEIIISTQF
jgi:hypothetical protein